MIGFKQITWAEISARRLERHALSAPAQEARPADIVGVMCGAHAQMLSAAELSIGLRLAAITRKDIRDALWTERSLIKTYGPRGTVHLLPTQDLPMWIGALSAMPYARNVDGKNELLTPEQAEAFILTDLGVNSTLGRGSGVFVRLDGRHPLVHGDEILIGRTRLQVDLSPSDPTLKPLG